MAEDVQISAAVVGPKPTSAPVITKPVNNQRFTSIPITIEGTCQAGLLVNVYKNDVLAGASICDSRGNFSLQADLFIGRNDLVARMIDAANQSSPDSAVVTAFYDVTSTPNVSGSGIGSKGSLIIESESVYKGTVPGQPLSWPITIEGGVAPYALSIDWGDGKTDLFSRTTAGQFTITHTYDKPGGYKGGYVVTIKAVDAEGTAAMMQIVALVNNPVGSTAGPLSGDIKTSWTQLLVAWPLWIILVLMLVSFWLGEQREKKKEQNDRAGVPPVPVVSV